MSSSTIVITSGLAGVLSCAWFVIISLRRIAQSRAKLRAELEKAERDLLSDVKEIGIFELTRTRAGRELVRSLPGNSLLPITEDSELRIISFIQPTSEKVTIREARFLKVILATLFLIPMTMFAVLIVVAQTMPYRSVVITMSIGIVLSILSMLILALSFARSIPDQFEAIVRSVLEETPVDDS